MRSLPLAERMKMWEFDRQRRIRPERCDAMIACEAATAGRRTEVKAQERCAVHERRVHLGKYGRR